MSRPKQLLGLLVVPFLVVALLAACGTGPTAIPASPTSAGPTTDGPAPTVTVPFEMPTIISLLAKVGDAELAVLDEQIARFEAENPDILVEIKELRVADSGRYEKTREHLSGQQGEVDIVLVDDAWLAEFVSQGWLAPLGERTAAAGIRDEDFFQGSIKASYVASQLYALPRLADAGLLYYRQDLVGGNGSSSTSWAGLQRLALQAKTGAGLPVGYVWQGAAYESLTCNTLEFVWAYGGQVLDEEGQVVFDSPETRKALEMMAGLVSSQASPAEIVAMREAQTLEAFQNGDAALMRNWPYAWARLQTGEGSLDQGATGVSALPTSCLLGQGLALTTNSMAPEQAFRFIEYLADHEQQLEMAKALGRPPALLSVYDDAGLIAERPFLDMLRPVLSQARPRPQSPVYQALSAVIYTEVNRMLAGDQSAEETATRVQQQLEALVGP
jgi:multiple sugar transport system substrate-binding protein